MKRKQSFSNSTEESFDSLMAVSQKDIQGSNDGDVFITSDCRKHGRKELKLESDKESDCDGSENDKTKVTTLKMLYTKSQVDDIEFVNCCQQIGLLRTNIKTCDKCNKEKALICTRESQDGAIWHCQSCDTLLAVRHNSWCCDLSIPLKDLVTVIYCWTRGYEKDFTSFEAQIPFPLVARVFDKCQTVASDYFRNSVSNIGGPKERVFVDLFSENGIFILGGVEVEEKKNMFFILLGESPKRDDMASALVDNLSCGTLIETTPNSQLLNLLGEDGLFYLSSEWDLSVSNESPSSVNLVSPVWLEIKNSFPPDLIISFSDLDILLFRKRMETFKDPFLFFMAVIGSVYHDTS